MKKMFAILLLFLSLYVKSQTLLDKINSLRVLHQVGPVQYSEAVNKSAQDWANKNIFGHSVTRYGENIALAPNFIKAVDMWYDENKQYNYTRANYSPETGHFTQLVWKNTKYIGLGYINSKFNNMLIVMQFDPPGNMLEEFGSNVFPPTTTSLSPPPPLVRQQPPPPPLVRQQPPPLVRQQPPPLVRQPPPPPPPPLVRQPPPPQFSYQIYMVKCHIKTLNWKSNISSYKFVITL